MNILHLTCSARGSASESSRLSREIVGFLLKSDPTATLVARDLGNGALAHIDRDFAFSQQASEDVSEDGSAALSDALIRELDHADVVVIGTPMNNYTVPSTLKAWIDHVVRIRRTFDVSPHGKIGRLRDRPIFIAISSGGRFSGENARQPDFLTPYLKAILGMIGLHDLTFFSIQGTAFGADAVADARANADRMLQEHFSSWQMSRASIR